MENNINIFICLMFAFAIVYILSNWNTRLILKIVAIPFLSVIAGLIASFASDDQSKSFAVAVFSSFAIFILTAVFYPLFNKKFRQKLKTKEEIEETKKFINSNFR